MMVVAALRMVEVVGAAGRPRQMSWYLARHTVIMISDEDDEDDDGDDDHLPSEEEHSLMQSSLSFSKED